MSKFNIGDIVVPGKGADERYSITNSSMKKAEVIAIGQNRIEIRILQHIDNVEIGNEYWVDEDCFKKARKTNGSIVIYRKGNTVIATDKSTGKTAQATCMDSDTFNLADGQKLAFYRLMGAPEEKIREMLPHMFKKKETEKPFVIKQDHYNVGDKVLIVDEFTEKHPCVLPVKSMKKWLGKTMTIRYTIPNGVYRMEEDAGFLFPDFPGYFWGTAYIAGKVIDGVKKVKRSARAGEYVQVVELKTWRTTHAPFKKGEVYKAVSVDKAGSVSVESGRSLLNGEYVVLEGYTPEMQGEIKAGDKVIVVNVGGTYDTYLRWVGLGKYVQNFVKFATPNTKDRYTVLNVEKHGGKGFDDLVALIQNPKTTQVFIINVTALRKVEE